MTKIQIITIEYKEIVARVMLEDIGAGHYRKYSSSKFKDEISGCFSSFDSDSTVFCEPAAALAESILENNPIISITNELSDILTTGDISKITGCLNVKEV